MSEEQKRQEFINFLDTNVFEPAIRYGKENAISKIVSGVNLTRGRMSRLSSEGMVHFFWSAIAGTEKSNKFFKLLSDNGLVTFEHLRQEVTDRFGSEWLSA